MRPFDPPQGERQWGPDYWRPNPNVHQTQVNEGPKALPSARTFRAGVNPFHRLPTRAALSPRGLHWDRFEAVNGHCLMGRTTAPSQIRDAEVAQAKPVA